MTSSFLCSAVFTVSSSSRSGLFSVQTGLLLLRSWIPGPAWRGCLESYYETGFQPSFDCARNSWGFGPQNSIQVDIQSAESASLYQPGAQPQVCVQSRTPRAEGPLHRVLMQPQQTVLAWVGHQEAAKPAKTSRAYSQLRRCASTGSNARVLPCSTACSSTRCGLTPAASRRFATAL